MDKDNSGTPETGEEIIVPDEPPKQDI